AGGDRGARSWRLRGRPRAAARAGSDRRRGEARSCAEADGADLRGARAGRRARDPLSPSARDGALLRLNAYLARAGVASRRRADALNKAGRVAVNGELGKLNTSVENGHHVSVSAPPAPPQPPAYSRPPHP